MNKIVFLAGDAHRYQYLIVIICFLIWSIFPIFSCGIAFLQKNSLISYYDPKKNETIVESLSYTTCLWENNYTVVESYDYSWAIDLNISCDKLKISLIGALSSLGGMIGSAFSSVVTRAFGQRRVMLITSILFILLLLISLFVINYIYFCFVLVLCQICANTMLYSVMIIFSEIVSQRKKPIFSAWINSGLAVGGVIYIFLFYVCQEWKYVFVCSMVIVFLLEIAIYFLFLDSPKIMIELRDIDNFLKSMRFIAKINGRLEIFNKGIKEKEYQIIISILSGKKLSENNALIKTTLKANQMIPNSNEHSNKNNLDDANGRIDTDDPIITNKNSNGEILTINGILNKSKNISKEDTKPQPVVVKEQQPLLKVTPWSLMKYKSVRGTFLLFCFLWFCNRCLSRGLSIGLKSLPGSIYVNGLMLYSVETVAYFVSGPMMNVKCLGRKYSLILFTASFSVCCFFMIGLFDFETVCVVFYVFTRFCSMSSFCIYYTYCLESYPSSIKGLAYGINGACNSFGGVVIPFIIEYISRQMLYVVYSILGIGCALLMLFLRETLGQTIPDNIKEMEETQLVQET